ALVGLALMATLTRPPGVVLIPLVILSLWFFVRPWSERRRRALAILLAVLVIASVLVRTAIAADPGRWPFQALRPMITASVAREKQGEVIHDRVEAYRPAPHSFSDHL